MLSTHLLRGLSWDHSRAFPPAVAAAQRYEETHPGVRILWEKHSLNDFGHAPVDVLADKYDLLIIDHPSLGYTHAQGCLLPLDDKVNPEALKDLEAHSVGGSFQSYRWADRLWALPIDAACPASSWRPSRLEEHGPAPRSWKDLLRWADAGRVLAPGFGPDLLLHLLALCATEDASCGVAPDAFAPEHIALESLESLRELFSLLPAEVFGMNPIAVYERLSSRSDGIPLYCPFAYTYSNYARVGYCRYPLVFGEPPASPSGKCLRTVLGGTGLAISARCKSQDIAVDFAAFMASEAVQRTFYMQAGGQPAHLRAWEDGSGNALTGEFFRNTLPAVQRAWTRPRFNGFVGFQEQAGGLIQEWIQRGGPARTCLHAMNKAWQEAWRRGAAQGAG